jgi:hypothetical protein
MESVKKITLETKTEIKDGAAHSHWVSVKLKRATVENMISTYEFLVWTNVGDEKKECQRILKALHQALAPKNQ